MCSKEQIADLMDKIHSVRPTFLITFLFYLINHGPNQYVIIKKKYFTNILGNKIIMIQLKLLLLLTLF